MPDATFPGRLRILREKAGLTVAELADRAGLHRVHVYQLEAGKRAPTWDTVQKLADALGVKTDDFRRPAE